MRYYQQKVYAYITHQERLLVFRHVGYPETGIQVPGGTLEDGESPVEGIIREVYEETGLADLKCKAYLGSEEFVVAHNRSKQFNLRHFFHMLYVEEPSDTWQHYELHPSDGTAQPILFEFHWIPVVEAAWILHPYYTAKLDALGESLGNSSLLTSFDT
jgi:8-oxo-dGTP pyrophosphatase MutT (NUDIX family)